MYTYYTELGIHKDEKHKIKQLLLHFLPDLFYTTRGELSDDEDEDGMIILSLIININRKF